MPICAIQVAVWQQTSGTSPVSQAALESVNQAFASADVSRGSDFATNFNSALSNEGGALAPTVLTSVASSRSCSRCWTPPSGVVPARSMR